MTPNDKAYFEYGRAFNRMNISRREILRRSKVYLTVESCLLDIHEINVKSEWDKRALCRRECKDCIHCVAKAGTDARRMCPKLHDYVFAESRCINCRHFEPKKGVKI